MENTTIKDFSTNISEEFNNITKNLEDFLTINNKKTEQIKRNIKHMYDFLKCDKNLPQGNGLPELIIDQFGHEEIWSQLELENDPLYFGLITDISKVLTTINKNDLNEKTSNLSESDQSLEKELQIAKSNSSESEFSNYEVEEDGKSEKNEESNSKEIKFEKQSEVFSEEEKGDNMSETSEEQDENTSKAHDEKIEQSSSIDDKFFNLKEMEKFLNDEDQKVMKKSKKKSTEESDESDIDYFAETDNEESDTDNNLHYKQFFDDPYNTNKEMEHTQEEEEEEKESGDENDYENDEESENELDPEELKNESEPVSNLELRQERLNKKIGHLEDEILQDKSWQLKGEITADTRPQNSLLEEVLDFDVTARPNIVVTQQTNMLLEDIIIQRIKDKAWDSVKRKIKPVDDPLEFKKKLALDSEKSKESLAQIYEKEYLKQKETLENDTSEKNEEESAEKVKTTAMINNLFSKLDALSHFYFTPRLVKPEAKIVSNLPAVVMEEVAPVAVSDATLLAPEEVKAKQKADPMAKDERTKTDKKRERRIKKIKQRKRRLERETKSVDLGEPKNKKQAKHVNSQLLKQVTQNQNVQLMKASNVSANKSSEKFFNQLQDQINNQINVKLTNKSQKNQREKSNLTAKKLKL